MASDDSVDADVDDSDIEDAVGFFDGYVELGDGTVRVARGRRMVSTSLDLGGLSTTPAALVEFVTAASDGLEDVMVNFDVDCDIDSDYGYGGELYDVAAASAVTVRVVGWRPLTGDERRRVAERIMSDRREADEARWHRDIATYRSEPNGRIFRR